MADANGWPVRHDCENQRPAAGEEHQTGDAGACKVKTLDDALRGGQRGQHGRQQPPEPADGCERAAQPGLDGVADGLSSGLDKMLTIWEQEPDIPRVATGIPNRADRLKCLGNAVVPQQAYPIFKALRKEMERWT